MRIAPMIQPSMPIAAPAEIEAARAASAAVQVASYRGGKLHALDACSLFPLQAVGYFAMTCQVQHGDSGGPIVLMTPAGPRLIGLVHAQGKKASVGTSAALFGPLVD